MSTPFAESPEFQRLLARDSGSSLIRVAMEIARDAYPELDPSTYIEKVDRLAARIRDRCPASAKPRQVLGQINWVLFVEEGFHGNTEDYYDPRNSYLNEVIDRKTGIPIALSVLYATIAERLGLTMAGVNLPRHFMLRFDPPEGPIFVDAFHSGALLDRQGCDQRISELIGEPVELTDRQLAPCGADLIVARMLCNLKAIYLGSSDFASALPVQKRLAALKPDDPEEQRDLGMLCLQLDKPAGAIGPFQAYLDARPGAADADPIRALLLAARREVAAWN